VTISEVFVSDFSLFTDASGILILSLSLFDAFSTRKIFQKILQVLKGKGSVAFGLKIVVMAKCYECYHQYVD
jgi:hypothetical protein